MKFEFKNDEYKSYFTGFQTKIKKYFFVHIPFVRISWFALQYINKDYEKYDYLNYLYKEIDLLFEHLNKNNIKLNVGTVFFGGGSPTILNREDLKLVDKLHGLFDWSNVEFSQ